MGLDIVGYLETTDVDLVYSGQNVGANDVAMECPFCDDPSTHLTVHRTTGYLNCWRCNFDDYKSQSKKGWRPSFKALIREIEKCSWGEAKRIYESLGGDSDEFPYSSTIKQEICVEKCDFPSGTVSFDSPGPYSALRDKIYGYLMSRNFTKYHIQKYGLHFCGMGAYTGRIIIPYYLNGKVVNWVGRRTSRMSKGRYLNCRIDSCCERMANMLYGQETFEGKVLRLVEGAFDKMRIGDSALGLSRSTFSSKQRNIILQLAKYCDFISLMLDPEAEKRAISIAEELSVGGKKIKIVQLPLGLDPAEMTPEEILYHENKAEFFHY
jgi:hypothetical protein